LIFALAERKGIELPYADLDELRALYEFTDLQSFLDLYYANMAVLRTEQDFADVTRAYPSRAAAGGVRLVEIMMDPQAHISRGVALETCVNGVASALATSAEEFGVSTLLIAAFLRDLSEESALEVPEQLLAMKAPIAGIGLDSAEVGNPPSKFERLPTVPRRPACVESLTRGRRGRLPMCTRPSQPTNPSPGGRRLSLTHASAQRSWTGSPLKAPSSKPAPAPTASPTQETTNPPARVPERAHVMSH